MTKLESVEFGLTFVAGESDVRRLPAMGDSARPLYWSRVESTSLGTFPIGRPHEHFRNSRLIPESYRVPDTGLITRLFEICTDPSLRERFGTSSAAAVRCAAGWDTDPVRDPSLGDFQLTPRLFPVAGGIYTVSPDSAYFFVALDGGRCLGLDGEGGIAAFRHRAAVEAFGRGAVLSEVSPLGVPSDPELHSGAIPTQPSGADAAAVSQARQL